MNFWQQLILACIAAAPPTAAVIITAIVLARGQKKMGEALDGKLTQLMTAEKGVSKAEGVAEERLTQQAKTGDAPQKVEVVTPSGPVPVELAKIKE